MIVVVNLEDAIGMPLAHDVTKIVPGFKGPAFRRGHVIREEDIPELLSIGKEHVSILRLEVDEVHEDEAAVRIAQAVMGPGLVEISRLKTNVGSDTAVCASNANGATIRYARSANRRGSE